MMHPGSRVRPPVTIYYLAPPKIQDWVFLLYDIWLSERCFTLSRSAILGPKIRIFGVFAVEVAPSEAILLYI